MQPNTVKLQTRLAHFRTAINRGTTYKMGAGGYYPSLPLPRDVHGDSDCSGALSWALGISRFQGDKNKPWSKEVPWIETTAMYNDALGAHHLFQVISTPVAGCILVYPDRKVLGFTRSGHTGMYAGGGRVVHCSSGNNKRGDAIQETDDAVFVKGKAIAILLNEDFV